MPKATGFDLIGRWAFVIAVIIAIIVGLWPGAAIGWTYALIILGLLVGLLNVGVKEATPFILAGIALVIVSAFGKDVMGTIVVVGSVLDSIMAVVVPATVIVALREVFEIARK